jgi:hypothetical protein
MFMRVSEADVPKLTPTRRFRHFGSYFKLKIIAGQPVSVLEVWKFEA